MSAEEIYIGHVPERLVGVKCPHCGRLCDGATSLDLSDRVNTPKPGDFSVCLYCGALLAYTEILQLRKIERTERRRMARDPKSAKLVKIAQAVSQRMRREWQ